MADQRNRVSQLYAETLTRTVAERAAFLRRACGDDEALRLEVESLLAHASDPPSILEAPLGSLAAAALGDSGASLIGRAVGGYHILATLGAGGMGEVYRARDTKLGRDVAIKVLPQVFASDRDRLGRFAREAHVLAALNHPHIGAIYGLEDLEGTPALVLELVEGDTLADRIATGPLAIAEALTVARQIAEALEAAHERGIVHRDLKPANIKITAAGIVKVLDFGLAKVAAGSMGQLGMQAPTLEKVGSRDGLILGTAAYMSPEQARGQAVDKRTDVWAFGCVLYEMLVGRASFPGETVSDTIAAILERTPDWNALPTGTPAGLQQLLRRCLDKEPKRRVHDIADARIEIEDALSQDVDTGQVAPAPLVPPRSSWPRRVVWSLTGVAVAAIVVVSAVWYLKPEPRVAVARFTIPLASDETLNPMGFVAISGDGERVAYVAIRNGTSFLFLRHITEVESTLVSGTDGASLPFFSPDGQWVAFFAGGKLKKVPVSGGPPAIVCDAPNQRGGAWAPDDTIVFAPAPQSGLMRVAATGGTPTPLTTLSENEGSHRYPQILPDGKAVLFAAGPPATATSWNEAHIVVQSLTSGERRVLVQRGTYPRYLETGHLLYVEAGTIFALPFDVRRLESRGVPVPLSEKVVQTSSGSAAFDVSRAGSLVLVPSAGPRVDSLVWVDRRGNVKPTGLAVAMQSQPRVSPDGKRLTFMVAQPDTDIWVYDVARRTSIRFTTGGGNLWPIWTRDGQRIAFTSIRTGVPAGFWKAADGTGPEDQLTATGMPSSWSPDGRTLGFGGVGLINGLWFLPLETRKPVSFLRTTFVTREMAFSPDGRWVAYVSNESGREEVYVTAFPEPSARWPVSRGPGNEPVWNPNGRELFFRHNDDMMAVDVRSQTAFTSGVPHRLFAGHFTPGLDRANYDVTPDGERFVMVKPTDDVGPPPQVTVVLNWASAISDRLAHR